VVGEGAAVFEITITGETTCAMGLPVAVGARVDFASVEEVPMTTVADDDTPVGIDGIDETGVVMAVAVVTVDDVITGVAVGDERSGVVGEDGISTFVGVGLGTTVAGIADRVATRQSTLVSKSAQ
jgi:hypothetical protein